MKKKKREKFVDDGRTIADMNVDGMPGHSIFPRDKQSQSSEVITDKELTKEEKRAMMWGVVSAALLVTFVFFGAFALFILFCIKIWF